MSTGSERSTRRQRSWVYIVAVVVLVVIALVGGALVQHGTPDPAGHGKGR